MMATKRCSKCGEWKPRTEFYVRKDRASGLTSECKSCLKQRQRKYNATYAPVISERKRAEYRAKYSLRRAQLRASYQRHAEKRRAEAIARYAQHRGRWIAYFHRRRALKRNNGGSYSHSEWRALCELYGNKCVACGSWVALTVDHVVPLSKGGRNDITNIQPLCLTCNLKKGQQAIDYRPAVNVAAWAQQHGYRVVEADSERSARRAS